MMPPFLRRLAMRVARLEADRLEVVTGTVDSIAGNVATITGTPSGTIEALCWPSLVSVSDQVRVQVGQLKRGTVIGPAA